MTTPDKEEMPTDRTEGQFRKKPVVVDAVQLRQRFLWPDWFHDAVSSNVIITHGLGKYGTGPVYCEIKTLEGVMRANAGDWVVRGTQGEIYPCKPDIFIEIYEPVGIATAFNAYEPMREALSELLNATIEDCGDGSEFPDDDGGVALRGDGKESAVTFAIIRRSLAALKGVPQPATPKESAMTEAQIKHMVDRFLMWKLPEHFNPDGGISFEPFGSKGTPHEYRRDPVGMNLLSAEQATAMVCHMLEGVPQPASSPSLEAALKTGIASIKDELNTLALVGAVPMWGSLIGRLDQLEAELFPASEAEAQ